ncbi:hypothetical protein TNCV_5049181 [Trichonephila clavipes]|nr:hypothetical protein TNCV_5049181 [Trichonephila clavipes]
MATRNNQDTFPLGRIMGKLEAGHNVMSVAQEFGIDKIIVSRTWKALQRTSTAVKKVGNARSRKPNASDDWSIFWQAKSKPEPDLGSSLAEDHYYDEIILPHGLLFRGAISPDFVFVDGNAYPHRISAIEELLEREDIYEMDWSECRLIQIPLKMYEMLKGDAWLHDHILPRTKCSLRKSNS